jgi:hypothetical protein
MFILLAQGIGNVSFRCKSLIIIFVIPNRTKPITPNNVISTNKNIPNGLVFHSESVDMVMIIKIANKRNPKDIDKRPKDRSIKTPIGTSYGEHGLHLHIFLNFGSLEV